MGAGPMLTPQAGLPSSFLERLMQIGSHLFIVTPVNALSIASAFQRLVTPLYSASLEQFLAQMALVQRKICSRVLASRISRR